LFCIVDMQITQIYLTDNNSELPPFLADATDTVSRCFPTLPHKIYNNKDVEQFLEQHYGEDVIRAYHKVKPYSYKCDLARYCIANVVGGWYFDISLRCLTSVQLPDDCKLLAFRDINRYTHVSWACDGAVFYTKPDNEILDEAIFQIVYNIENEYYGLTPLCPTGPTAWGKAIAGAHIDKHIIFGDSIELTPQHYNKNKALVLPDGTIFALKKPSQGGDLKALGATGVNNYNDLWYTQDLYVK
jgi:mannosyltransferase OCH1-like enzyme